MSRRQCRTVEYSKVTAESDVRTRQDRVWVGKYLEEHWKLSLLLQAPIGDQTRLFRVESRTSVTIDRKDGKDSRLRVNNGVGLAASYTIDRK